MDTGKAIAILESTFLSLTMLNLLNEQVKLLNELPHFCNFTKLTSMTNSKCSISEQKVVLFERIPEARIYQVSKPELDLAADSRHITR